MQITNSDLRARMAQKSIGELRAIADSQGDDFTEEAGRAAREQINLPARRQRTCRSKTSEVVQAQDRRLRCCQRCYGYSQFWPRGLKWPDSWPTTSGEPPAGERPRQNDRNKRDCPFRPESECGKGEQRRNSRLTLRCTGRGAATCCVAACYSMACGPTPVSLDPFYESDCQGRFSSLLIAFRFSPCNQP
jgi:hypothetical protein